MYKTYLSKNGHLEAIMRVTDDNYSLFTVTSTASPLSGVVRLTKEQIKQLYDHAFGNEQTKLLKEEIRKAQNRQQPNAKKDSGHIRGLKNAINIIETCK